MVFDVSEQEFQQRVLERSHEVPVIVDFWAAWCGPCRVLGPALERAVTAREGEVELAKVDVDANQALAASFAVRGIPAVKAFRDGRVVDEFTGAISPAQVEAFLDRLLPSPADKLVAAGDERSLRKALELDPAHTEAAGRLARILLRRGDRGEALELLDRFQGDFLAEGLAARARLEIEAASDGADPGTIARAFAAWDEDDHAAALEALLQALHASDDAEVRDLLRQVMVAIFTELGTDHPLTREHRRRLSAALN